jgi:hypothetical protein
MVELLMTEILLPLARRLGSIGAGALVAYGVTSANAAMVEEILVAVLLIAGDLYSSASNRKGKK